MARGKGVGIDVSKATVDVAVHEVGYVGKFERTAEGLAEVAKALSAWKAHRVVVEASGGYEELVVTCLHEAGLPVVLLEPSRARNFAKAIGRHAKTDEIDAVVLAHMATVAVEDTALWQPRSEEVQYLRDLVRRREQLLVVRESERKRRRTAGPIALKSIKRVLQMLKKEVAQLDRQIDKHVTSTESLREFAEVAESVDGVGRKVSSTLLAFLPELGHLDRRAIASLAGLAPMNRDSGTKQSPRHIKGGRKAVRRVLYMAAMVGLKHNAHVRAMFKRLVGRGKVKKVALVACMRKLLLHLNSLFREVHRRPTLAAA